jgi:hypothetical protein
VSEPYYVTTSAETVSVGQLLRALLTAGVFSIVILPEPLQKLKLTDWMLVM